MTWRSHPAIDVIEDLPRSTTLHLRRSPTERAALPVLVTKRVGERTYVGRVTSKGIQVLGSIPQAIRFCEFHEGLLVCGLGGDRTGVWRVSNA